MISRVSPISFLFVFCVILNSLEGTSSHRRSYEDEKSLREFEDFLEWRRNKEEVSRRGTANKIGERWSISESVDPPPVDQPARMGRFIVNQADWTAVATISSRKDILSFPIANVISVSDGPLGNGSGIPYMYLTPLDFTAQDLAFDDRATLLMTLAQGSYCKGKNMDPMDPRCARIILAGRIKKVTNSSFDYDTAKDAVFGRHSWLANMPADHHFFFAKLDIESIAVLDTFGGPKYVSIEDYMNPPNPKIHQKHHLRRSKVRSDEDSSYESEERKFVYRV